MIKGDWRNRLVETLAYALIFCHHFSELPVTANTVDSLQMSDRILSGSERVERHGISIGA